MNRTHLGSEHLTTSQVAAILDERLHESDRAPALAHLAACADCRRELAELHRALHVHARDRRGIRRWLVAVSGAAAALALITLPARFDRAPLPHDSPAATRIGTAAPTDRPPRLVIVAPTEGAAVNATTTFTWRSGGPDASYLVTVQDTSGAVAWSSTLTDTTVTLPATAGLVAGRHYFWSVDARLSDGASTTTGVRAFVVR
ncbi:MAG TPA: hypothetical protein VL383_18540 [Gemmatimonadaceae bacterium]|jgi:hypothetical protein|nr:hypothetical protein [Gemmatimonadaceae bacterium]